ncbi:MAG: cyanoexosortase B system-associated protein [Cyanobacteriota bacterium]|nr:cyanoexosortase B system-associated protein [Cyanobacteriota bacterium]
MVTQAKLPPQIAKASALVLLMVLLIVAAIPGYFTGKWSWADQPPLQTLAQLQQIREQGIEIAGWKTLEQKQLQIRGQEWLVQTIEQNDQTAIVLMRVQKFYKDRPQVEWMDLNSFQQWKTDSSRRIRLTTEPSKNLASPTPFTTHFFRSWTQSINPLLSILWRDCTSTEVCQLYQKQRLKQTYAVMQWYAWPDNGSPSPSQWFIADRFAQLSQQRAPWVAVNVLIPIEPLGDIQKVEDVSSSLSQTIQAKLMTEAFISKEETKL